MVLELRLAVLIFRSPPTWGGGSYELKINDGNNTYHVMRTSTSSYSQSASASTTFNTTADSPDGLESITNLTRVSTSNTVYQTRVSTSATLTRASTSATLTRASTYETLTRASTYETLTRASTYETLTRASTYDSYLITAPADIVTWMFSTTKGSHRTDSQMRYTFRYYTLRGRAYYTAQHMDYTHSYGNGISNGLVYTSHTGVVIGNKTVSTYSIVVYSKETFTTYFYISTQAYGDNYTIACDSNDTYTNYSHRFTGAGREDNNGLLNYVYSRVTNGTGYYTRESIYGYNTRESIYGYNTRQSVYGYNTRESVSGYATRESVSGYGTRVSTSNTVYETRESISGYSGVSTSSSSSSESASGTCWR